MGERNLPYLLNSRFPFLPKKEDFVYNPQEIPAPRIPNNCPFSSPSCLDFSSFLLSLYKAHLQYGNENMYIQSDNMTQDAAFQSIEFELICRRIIPFEFVKAAGNSAQINDKICSQFFTVVQNYFLIMAYNHFKALAQTPTLYPTPELKLELFKHLLFQFIPIDFFVRLPCPVIIPGKVAKNVLTYKKKANVVLIFYSKSKILLLTDPNSPTYFEANQMTIENNQTSAGTDITYILTGEDTRTTIPILVSPQYSSLLTQTLKMYPYDNNTPSKDLPSEPTNSFNAYQYQLANIILSSCQSLQNAIDFCPVLIDTYASMFLTHDYNFMFALLEVLDTPEGEEPLAALDSLYSVFGQRLRLLKFISYMLIMRNYENPDQVFRSNTQLTKLLINGIRFECRELFHELLPSIIEVLGTKPYFSLRLDEAKDEDLNILDDYFQTFWDMIMPNVKLIPAQTRALLRYHRIICEILFEEPRLNHRGLVRLFILRILSPAFSSTERLGKPKDWLAGEVLDKSVNFSKMIMALGTLDQSFGNVNQAIDRFRPILIKHSQNMLKFFEALTNVEGDIQYTSTHSSIGQLHHQLPALIKFVAEKSDKIRDKIPKSYQPPLALLEAISSLECSTFYT